MKRTLFFLTVLTLMCGLLKTSQAVPITVEFTGTIYSVGTSLIGDDVSVGDSVSGIFLYDTIEPDSQPSNTGYGTYDALAFGVTLGTSFSATSLDTTIRVQNDQQNGSATLPADGMTTQANSVTGDTLNGRSISAFQFGLRKENVSGHLWADDFLPDITDWAGVSLADINAPSWHWMQFDMMSDAIIFDSQIRWNINSFTISSPNLNPVPEPGTILLFAIGLLGLAGISRRKKGNTALS